MDYHIIIILLSIIGLTTQPTSQSAHIFITQF